MLEPMKREAANTETPARSAKVVYVYSHESPIR
jgi:hypothetical protein